MISLKSILELPASTVTGQRCLFFLSPFCFLLSHDLNVVLMYIRWFEVSNTSKLGLR